MQESKDSKVKQNPNLHKYNFISCISNKEIYFSIYKWLFFLLFVQHTMISFYRSLIVKQSESSLSRSPSRLWYICAAKCMLIVFKLKVFKLNRMLAALKYFGCKQICLLVFVCIYWCVCLYECTTSSVLWFFKIIFLLTNNLKINKQVNRFSCF